MILTPSPLPSPPCYARGRGDFLKGGQDVSLSTDGGEGRVRGDLMALRSDSKPKVLPLSHAAQGGEGISLK